MELYYTNIKSKGFRGKPRTTFPKVLNEDLNAYYNKNNISHDHSYCHWLKLNNKQDLEELRRLAQDGKGWKKLTTTILKTGEAATPNGGEAKLQ